MSSLSSPLRKLIRWLYSRLIKRPINRIKSMGRRTLVRGIGNYAIAALLGTYAVTGLTTPANLLNPAQVVSVASRSGILNVLTCGVATPLKGAFEGGLGSAIHNLGDVLGNESMMRFGTGLTDKAQDYFAGGNGVFDKVSGSVAPAAIPDWLSWLDTGIGVPAQKPEVTPVTDGDATTSDGNTDALAHELALQSWDAESAPNFYRLVDGETTIDMSVKAGDITYSALDSLGRTGRAVGNITYPMVEESAGWRAGFAPDVDRTLAGWGHNGKVTIDLPTGGTYSGYFWNRSHLIADSLGGYHHEYGPDGSLDKNRSRSETVNLVTGTRMQNVGSNNAGGSGYGGMAYFENLATSYLKEHQSCSIWYSVEPVYSGNELVPRANVVKMVSCDGGINVTGIVYNVAPGYSIDYATGEFSRQ